MDKRGPKLGDAASLWNFTPSPGWTKEESLILKICLMKFGIGQWVQIQATGLLQGKLIQQLCSATQRLMGQQSLAAFSGLRVDVDRVRAENEAKTDAKRKNGLVIWNGPNPTKEMKLQWQQEAKEKYGLSPEQQQEAEAAYEQMAAAVAAARGEAAAASAPDAHALPADCNILECDMQQLTTQQKQQLLCALHKRLVQVVSSACQQHPEFAELMTYQQQQQQGWIACGLPAQPAGNGSNVGSSKENLPGRALLLVRQAGTAAGKLHNNSATAGGSTGSKASKGGTSGRPPAGRKGNTAGKKRSRSKAAAATDDPAAADDDEEDFMQRQPRSTSGRRSSSSGGGSGPLSDLMKVALDAGVAQLVEMGYSRGKALDALKECHCDVELAVEYLTATCC